MCISDLSQIGTYFQKLVFHFLPPLKLNFTTIFDTFRINRIMFCSPASVWTQNFQIVSVVVQEEMGL